MLKNNHSFDLAPGITVGKEKMILLSGPCAVENADLCLSVASRLKELSEELDIAFIFKASFDKANRTSGTSFRSIGMDAALKILQQVQQEVGVPVITDIHESVHVKEVADVVDVLQIPAFLCRQTDLLISAAETGKGINVKKGQFMAAEDMQYAVNKIKETGNCKVCLTERGVSFGYHNLVVDMRSIPVMRQYAPVIFDVTHSVQQPGGAGGVSGGQRIFAPFLARAAAAVGVDGFFIETHPDPANALSDGPNMIPLNEMPEFLKMIKKIWEIGNGYY